MVARVASRDEPYRYTLGGLPRLRLIGITVHRCPKCSFDVPSIPQIEGLHRLITLQLLRKPAPLDGEEIRFLRKRIGLSQTLFARYLQMHQESLSRIERGERAIGDTTERWLRSVVAGYELNKRHVAQFIQRLAEGRTFETMAARMYELADKRWRKVAA